MGQKKAGYREAWEILKVIDDELLEQTDAKGNIANTGEARALNKMRKSLIREIDKDATDFLKQHGFNGYGLKKPRKK